jgi:hypothetical protein
MPIPNISPLEFTTIPNRDGLFIHFDAKTQTYLVQAFIKSDTLLDLRKEMMFDSQEHFQIDLELSSFDTARDTFLNNLFGGHAKVS